MHSPAYIVRALLVSAGLASNSKTEDWSSFTGFFPEEPDSAICTYDTPGIHDGNIMASGEAVIHPGVQIQVRSSDYSAVRDRADSIAKALDAVNSSSVAMADPSESWTILAVSRQGDLLNMGMEPDDDRRRHYFAVNVTLTLRKE